jgi:hypothetical protein
MVNVSKYRSCSAGAPVTKPQSFSAQAGRLMCFELVRRAGLFAFAVLAVSMVSGWSAPYAEISQRNAFRLHPIEPLQAMPRAEPLPKVMPTGITTLLERKIALLKVEWPARPGEAARTQSLILGEGERDGEVEMIEINADARTMKVRISGQEQLLDLNRQSPTGAAK